MNQRQVELERRKFSASLLRLLFHLVPLVPLAFRRYTLVVAAVLLVLLPYIKVKKLSQVEAALPEGPEHAADRRQLTAVIARWRWLTYWHS